jgi:hypothetical protein
MKKSFKIFGIIAVLLLALALGLANYNGKRASISKSLWVSNETDVTLNSLILDVDGKPLDEPIEILDSPLAAGDIRECFISLPEKQAKNAEWTVIPATEDEDAKNEPLHIDDMNPHGDNPVKGFYVKWFDRGGGHYSTGVSFQTFGEVLAERGKATDS